MKYILGKQSYKGKLPLEFDNDEKWSLAQLSKDHWLSEMQYYMLNREETDTKGRYSCKPYRKETGPNYVIPPL